VGAKLEYSECGGDDGRVGLEGRLWLDGGVMAGMEQSFPTG